MYRSRVRKVSCSYRSHCVVELPDPHRCDGWIFGAEDGIRTRDPHHGKVMLYH